MIRFKIYKNSALIIFSLFLYVAADAQKQMDSLSVYLEIAAKNNPIVVQKFYEYQAALQKVPQVGSLPDPELNIGYFLNPMEQLNGNQIADIKLMQMFPWTGTLTAAKDEMSLMAKASYESFLDARSTVFYEVESTWYELYKSEKEIQITSKNIAILKMIERLAIVKYASSGLGSNVSSISDNSTETSSSGNSSSSSGMNSMSGNSSTMATSSTQSMQSGTMGSSTAGSGLADLFKIKLALQDIQNDSALLLSQKKTILAKFNSYLNRQVESTVYIPDSLQLSVLGMPLESVPDSIKANSPMLAMLVYEQKSLASKKEMATKMGYPMIGIGLNYSIIGKSDMVTSSMNGKNMIMPMVSITLPIYRKKYKAAITEAELLNNAKEQEYFALVNTLQTEYYEAVQLYLDAERRMKLFESQIQLTAQTLDILISSYTSSGSELSDLLLVQQQLLEYEFNREVATVDYNTAVAFLNQLMSFSITQ